MHSYSLLSRLLVNASLHSVRTMHLHHSSSITILHLAVLKLVIQPLTRPRVTCFVGHSTTLTMSHVVAPRPDVMIAVVVLHLTPLPLTFAFQPLSFVSTSICVTFHTLSTRQAMPPTTFITLTVRI